MFYKVFRFICKALFILFFWSIKTEGEESINNGGPIILAANHVSYIDPIALGVAIKRPIRFIGKQEVFENPFLGFFARALGAIPVDRKKVNFTSIKKSISLLKNNHIIGIFPEGTRSLDGKLQELNSGMLKIALKTSSPIVPVGINGTFDIYPPKAKMPKFFKRKTIYLHFGRPIYLDYNKGKDIQYQKESLLNIQKKIKELTNN
ncbi:MAG: lysophospholipid acyltransferase family protein [Atribacterota bacterium]